MAENLLENGGFEADWGEEQSNRVLVFPADAGRYETELGELHTPPSWLTWYYHDPGNWGQPEVGDIRSEHVPYRVHEGNKAARLFTFYRKHDAGFLQQVEVEPGQGLRLSAWAHAWSNHPLEGHEECADDPRCSCGVGKGPVYLMEEDVPPPNGDPWNDAIDNVSFMVGIDPTGGTDPFSETVVWGPVAHIYNEYDEVPAVEAVAEASTVTVFLRSRAAWAFKHNDVYWDAVELVAVEVSTEPEASPRPQAERQPEPKPWSYRVIREGSKIGVHSIRANNVVSFSAELKHRGTQFPVVKAVDDFGWLAEVKRADPDVITIGRYTSRHEGCGELDDRDCDVDALAARLLGVIEDKAGGDIVENVDYWEIANEPDPPGPDGYGRLAALMIACMEQAEAKGLKLALFGLNAGTPEWDEMKAMVETGVFARARQGGHILTLHEGTFDTHDPQDYWPDTIPGSPTVDGAGPLHFRYRFLYHLLEERGEAIPLVVSEWYLGDEQAADVDTIVDALTWYDSEASSDYYVWAFCPFTLGPTEGWSHTDYERVYLALVEHMVAVKDRQNALALGQEPNQPDEPDERPAPDFVPPRVPYKRSYVLLPQIQDPLQRLEWRTAAALGSSLGMQTVGHSADDAGVGPAERLIMVINPSQHGSDLRAWYREHYPGAGYREIEVENPWETALRLLPQLEEDIALGRADVRWASYDFGEEPGGGTMGEYGGLLTGLAILLRKVYRRGITPPLLDKLLVGARAAFADDDALVWDAAVGLFSAFDDSIEDDNQRSIEELRTLRNGGWEMVLRLGSEQQAKGEHFVYLEGIEDGVFHVIDAQTGERTHGSAGDRIADVKGIRAAHVRKMPDELLFDSMSEGVEVGEAVPPREPYDRTYVLLPQIDDVVDRLEWRVAASIGSSHAMATVGHSADDAGTGPPIRRIVAVNPALWEEGLEEWYDDHYPNATFEGIEAETPWEMAINLLRPLESDIALAQNDERWAHYDFGEHPDAREETIGRYGCFLTGLSIILRNVYRRDVTPPVLDKVLVTARSAYVRDNLMAWSGVAPLFPAFDEGIKDFQPHTAAELGRLLDDDWEVILRRADGEHFVYLEGVDGETLNIIDTWDGKRKQRAAGDYAGVRALHVKEGVQSGYPEVLIGVHDETGGRWMAEQGLAGCCLVHRQVQQQAVHLDFEHLQEAGSVVIARLNWGYADGTGTLPRPKHGDAFVEAVVETMLAARGVDFFHVGNEPNNRQEWPGFRSSEEYPLTREYVTEIYNDIWNRLEGRVKIGPPPIDPYFGPGSNNRGWWTYMLEHIDGADALFLHSKTQTNDPAEVWSEARFADQPLEWQYLNLRSVQTGLEVLPDRFKDLPVFVTEVNPQLLDADGPIGWKRGNGLWVRQAVRFFREVQPVAGIVFYRYDAAGDQAPFGLVNRPTILSAIAHEARRRPSPDSADVASPPPGLPSPVWRRVVEARA